ncbi:C45 family peptidase [Aminipila sp.]|uniref:C45 family peptidase n=1 Tax=Aminipila sp. TaxID=2060095 RepID=UPI00289F0565|nr:C45 family peptidase [Aminipila sp.]
MYQLNFKGSHYDAGLQFGSKIKSEGWKLKEQTITDISEERMEYVGNAVEIYQREYPEILEEIKGIADGQEMEFELLAAFILGMYSFTIDNHCTCIALRTSENHMIFGRNSDFLVELESKYGSYCYDLDNSYRFIGNSTAFVEMEDGINEHGLAVGFTFIYSREKKLGLNAGIIVRYLLEKCRTVEECIKALEAMTIGSAQTLTIADPSGDMAVVECNAHELVTIRPKERPCVYTTNHFNSVSMKKYMEAPEDILFSHLRYKVASEALSKEEEYTFDFVKDLLSGKKGFMCQYDRALGADTVWSSLYDLTALKYYRCEGNPSREIYKEDLRMQSSCKKK